MCHRDILISVFDHVFSCLECSHSLRLAQTSLHSQQIFTMPTMLGAKYTV